MTETSQEAVPTLFRRFVALFVDWLLCLLVSGFFVPDLRTATWEPVAVLILEYAFFLGLFGQTPGMRLARIRCVSVDGGGPIGVPRAALRGFLLALVVPALIMDTDRRGVHDRFARSVITPA
ncbi:RDD family protein [Hamadaea sp. NPDC050747]|uniref:RDD family protein n=1 Tax=Hamadaea sp. NPDC050747 TaxID=3155789 RepID=UPI0033EE90D9